MHMTDKSKYIFGLGIVAWLFILSISPHLPGNLSAEISRNVTYSLGASEQEIQNLSRRPGSIMALRERWGETGSLALTDEQIIEKFYRDRWTDALINLSWLTFLWALGSFFIGQIFGRHA